jgi:hypothetical protein
MAINIVFFAEKLLDNKALMSGARLSGSLVNQFKPSVAKSMYDFFKAKNVLDFSSGWGDRLVGFLASGARSYTGIDPNTELESQYEKIVEDSKVTDKNISFICAPAEDVDYSRLSYDFAFTSPPYFNLEIYSSEKTQSANKQTKFDDWISDFLFKTLGKVYGGLDEGGRFAININDIQSQGLKICRPMIEYMESLGATYEGVIGMEIASRPMNAKGSVSRGSQEQRAEPIFVWAKGEAPEPRWKPETFFEV